MTNFKKRIRLPGKRDKQWLVFILPTAFALFLILAAASKIMLSLEVSSADVVVWCLLSGIAAAVLCGFGYADLKLAFGWSLAGVIAGILFMMYVFTRDIEMRGLVGLVSGAQLAFIFFIIGVNLQMLNYLRKKKREGSYGTDRK